MRPSPPRCSSRARRRRSGRRSRSPACPRPGTRRGRCRSAWPARRRTSTATRGRVGSPLDPLDRVQVGAAQRADLDGGHHRGGSPGEHPVGVRRADVERLRRARSRQQPAWWRAQGTCSVESSARDVGAGAARRGSGRAVAGDPRARGARRRQRRRARRRPAARPRPGGEDLAAAGVHAGDVDAVRPRQQRVQRPHAAHGDAKGEAERQRAVARPMRRPVNVPGPVPTTIASTSDGSTPDAPHQLVDVAEHPLRAGRPAGVADSASTSSRG